MFFPTVLFTNFFCFHYKNSFNRVTKYVNRRVCSIATMDENTVNPNPFHLGGKFGPGQEMYYMCHKVALWKLYRVTKNLGWPCNKYSDLYRMKKDVLVDLCNMLQLDASGTKDALICRLEHYPYNNLSHTI